MRFSDLAEILEREIGADQAGGVLARICRECQGETVYIPARADRPQIKPSDTPKTVAKRYGVSRRTAYTWLARRRR